MQKNNKKITEIQQLQEKTRFYPNQEEKVTHSRKNHRVIKLEVFDFYNIYYNFQRSVYAYKSHKTFVLVRILIAI